MSCENPGNGFSKLLSFKNVLGEHAQDPQTLPPSLSTFQYLTLCPWKARIDNLEEDENGLKNFSLTLFQLSSLLFVTLDGSESRGICSVHIRTYACAYNWNLEKHLYFSEKKNNIYNYLIGMAAANFPIILVSLCKYFLYPFMIPYWKCPVEKARIGISEILNLNIFWESSL